MDKKLLLTPREVASMTGFSYQTVVQMCQAGQFDTLPHAPYTTWRIKRSSVEKLVQA